MRELERRKQFGKFLIRRFLFTIVGIMVCEMILVVSYDRLLLPWLSDVLHWDVLGIWDHRQVTKINVIPSLFYVLVVALLMLLPEGIRSVLQPVVLYLLPVSMRQRLSGSYGTENSAYGLVYLGYFLIGLLLLLILIAPFCIGAWIYSHMIWQNVKRMTEEDKRLAEEEQWRRNLLLSDIAHDLKTPMTTVSGYAMALCDGMVADTDKQREYLGAIVDKTRRMDSMVELLLDYARLESGGMKMHLQLIDVGEWLRNLVAELYDELEEAGIQPVIDIPEEVRRYSIDPVQFGRVVVNLVSNARKHMKTGRHILIYFRSVPGRNGFRLTVADDGIPIPAELSEHIFDPFVRGDASRSSQGGSGLGLSIVAQIVSLHGGKIWLNPSPAAGYTKAFVIEIGCGDTYFPDEFSVY